MIRSFLLPFNALEADRKMTLILPCDLAITNCFLMESGSWKKMGAKKFNHKDSLKIISRSFVQSSPETTRRATEQAQETITPISLRIATNTITSTMQIVVASLFLALGSASAFAPSSQQSAPRTSLAATAELDGMVGVDIETGKKIVSSQ
jgi:hypothetical protein